MSDITPRDSLAEALDTNAEYAAAAAKKAGLPESVEYVEMRTEYGVRDRNGTEWWPGTRKSAEDAVMDGGGSLITREHITTAAREVRSTTKPKHVGGRVNAEDCPACAGLDLPYPWICPGDSAAESP